MKKLILFLLTATALVSCGSDDSDGGAKRPSMVAVAGGPQTLVANITYDNKGRISTITSNSTGSNNTYTLSYNDKGKVSSATPSNPNMNVLGFTYDTDGKLVNFMQGADSYPVTHQGDAAVTIDNIDVTFDAQGDIATFDTAVITRGTGKGAFANVKGGDGLVWYLIEPLTLYFGSKRPIQSLSGGTTTTMVNTIESGYISMSTFAIAGTNYTMNVTY